MTPTFYYFGWYVYGCFQEGWPKDGHGSPTTGVEVLDFGFCGNTAPWAAQMGPNLQDHISAVFFLAFLLFSWTTASIMSGALIERVRLSAYLILAAVLGSFVWIMDASWGWSSGGWLTTRFGFHDSIASLVVHGVAGAFALGVLLNLGPRIGKYTVDGALALPRPQHPSHVDGADADLHRLLRLLRRLPRHPVDRLPGLAQHLPLAHDARCDRVRDHVRLRGRVHRRLVRQQGRSILDLVRRSRRRDLRVRGRRRLPPVARVPALDLGRHARRLRGGLHREEASSRRRGRCGCRARRLRLYGVFLVGIFAGGYPTGSTTSNRRSAASSWACSRSCRSRSCPATS